MRLHSGFDIGAIGGSLSAALTSAASSICCIGPLAITLLGVNGAILGAAIKPYRPLLLFLALALLGFAYWRVIRPPAEGRDILCPARSRHWQKAIFWFSATLWAGALLIGIAADRYRL